MIAEVKLPQNELEIKNVVIENNKQKIPSIFHIETGWNNFTCTNHVNDI